MNIFGIYALDGLPVMEAIRIGYDLATEDPLEVAKRFYLSSERRYTCIMLVMRGDSSVVFPFYQQTETPRSSSEAGSD